MRNLRTKVGSRYVRQKLVEPSLSHFYYKYIKLQNETDVRTVDPSFELISSGEATWHSQTASNESNYQLHIRTADSKENSHYRATMVCLLKTMGR